LSKRNLFEELKKGLREARKHDQGKLTLHIRKTKKPAIKTPGNPK